MKQELQNICFQKDCDDVSDEKNCKIVALDPEKYLKSKPPPSAGKKLPVTLRYNDVIQSNGIHCVISVVT